MHARRASGLIVLCLIGCASAPVAPAPSTPPSTPPTTPAASPPAAPVDPARAALLAANARVRGDLVETLHGEPVPDPYRALETDSPATQAWVEFQNARSLAYLADRPRPEMEARLSSLLNIGALRGASVAGSVLLYLSRQDAEETSVLRIVRADPRRPGQWTAPAVLLDPARFGARSAIDWYYLSPRGRYVAFGVSQNGDERSVLRVMEVATGRVLDEAIAHTKWCRLAWTPDERGFYYTRYPREGEPGFDAAQPDGYFTRLFHHALGGGADGTRDPQVFDPQSRTDRPSPVVSDDGRTVLVHLFRGWSEMGVYAVAHGSPQAPWTPATARRVMAPAQAIVSATIHRGRLYARTNEGAPRYRIVSLPAARVLAAPAEIPLAQWDSVVPEGEHPIDGFALSSDRLVVSRLENIVSRIRTYRLDGTPLGELTLPGEGSAAGVEADPLRDTVTVVYSSLVTPPTVLVGRLRAALPTAPVALTPVDTARTDAPLDQLVLSRASVPSADGTAINVFYVHRRGIAMDGTNPVLLYGYGGFNVSLTPSFRRDPLYWVERGGVYAIANLRGGAEFGEAWHRAGHRENKHHVFEDMEAVTRWLSTSGLSRPDRIALQGGSNGGLLMGAMLTRAPDTFRAAVSSVGLYDMVRFHRFPPAEIWTSELGDPEQADAFRWLYAYSPYHRVRDGVAYPAVWIETADHDTRVHWAHSTKFAARLQDATSSDRPVFFHMQRGMGHGSATLRSEQLRTLVRVYTFLEDQLAMTAPPAATPPAAPAAATPAP